MIIGFHGYKGVGKDTAAQYLIDEYEFTKVAFADILKEAVANLFNITVEQVDEWKTEHVTVNIQVANPDDPRYVPTAQLLYWREFLQRFGTEMGRNTFGKDFWVNQWEEYLYRNSMQDDDIVVTDVRFQNEAHKIQTMNGVVFRIDRPGYESDGHESEQLLPDLMIDGVISNNSDIKELENDVDQLYRMMRDGADNDA